MTELEYLARVEIIRKKIKSGQAQQALNELEGMYYIKPVRLRWIVAKAEAMIELNYSTKEIYNFIMDKALIGYGYDGQQELLDIYYKLAEINGDIIEKERICFSKAVLEQGNDIVIREYYGLLEQVEEEFLKDIDNRELLKKLAELYYIVQDYTMYYICMIIYNECEVRDNVKKMTNFGYLDLVLRQGSCKKSLLVMSKVDRIKSEVLLNLLVLLGQEVIVIDEVIEVEVESNINRNELLKISLDNLQDIDENVTIIKPIKAYTQYGKVYENIDVIMEHLIKESGELFNIFCSKEVMIALEGKETLKKNLQLLGGGSEQFIQDTTVFGWYGSYLKYIGMIYGIDAEKEINREAEYDFSIVIPARNSAKALRYTLMTCLNQDYDGTYEIILSDNSIVNNDEIYELFLELNDDRVKYYRTPFELPLPKSFEYAFLMAKGKFVFSIGSDDAVLPWGLSVLENTLKSLPNHQVVQWDRGFYAWPEFQKSQEHQFIIPHPYIKNKINVEVIKLNDYIGMLVNDPSTMYGLPMFYINSGYRREYLKELIEKTGRLWDGASQDIYMGLVNILLAKEIPLIQYPITIAGMTNLSIGANERKVREEGEAVEYSREVEQMSNMAGFYMSNIEKYIPALEVDTNLLYTSLYRCIARGLITREEVERVFKVENMFARSFRKLRLDDIKFDYRLHLAKYAASLHGVEIENWFDEELYSILTVPSTYEEPVSDVPLYATGFLEGGRLVLNASHFNVHNIYEASILFATIMGY